MCELAMCNLLDVDIELCRLLLIEVEIMRFLVLPKPVLLKLHGFVNCWIALKFEL